MAEPTDPRRRRGGNKPADDNGEAPAQAPRSRGRRPPRLNEEEAEKVIIDTDVFVKHLPEEFKKEDLQAKFEAFGEIKQFRLRVRQRRPLLSVSYATADSAKKAIDALNGKDYNGSELVVEIRRSIKRPDAAPQQQQQQQPKQQQQQQQQQPKRERKPRNPAPAAAAAAGGAAAEEQRGAPNPNNVFVGGISTEITEDDLKAFFGPGDYKVNVRGRFAVLSFANVADAKKALDKNNTKLKEFEVKVEPEKGRKIRSAPAAAPAAAGGAAAGGAAAGGAAGERRGRRRRARPANPKRLYFRNFVREVNDEDVKAKFPGIQRILHLGKLGMVIFDTEENANAALALKEVEFSGQKITIEKGREAAKDATPAQ